MNFKLIFQAIIAKKQVVLLVLILILAAFLRIYRISGHSEFLGDQGRTGLAILEAWRNRQLPLLGPPVLTGAHLGPFFYYLVGPAFIVGRFDPVAPAALTALFGVGSVYLVYVLTASLAGWGIGLLMALLFATAPSFVQSSRSIWEPNLVTPFVLLLLFSFWQIQEKKIYIYFLLVGASVGVLVQLHYPNAFLGFLVLLFALQQLTDRPHSIKALMGFLFLGLGVFILTLLPFLYYQATHQWTDLRDLLYSVLVSTGSQVRSPFIFRVSELVNRVVNQYLPVSFIPVSMLVVLAIFIFSHRRFWSWFLSIWFFGGIGALGLYKGDFFDHYLMFLVTIPLFPLAMLLGRLEKSWVGRIIWGLIILMIFYNLGRSDVWSLGRGDIMRVRSMTSAMIKVARGDHFSFTLINSPSFSDLHYRYYLELLGSRPDPITDSHYQVLFVACDSSTCPTQDAMRRMERLPTLCYEPHCSGNYPEIDLREFTFQGEEQVLDAKLFLYRRITTRSVSGRI